MLTGVNDYDLSDRAWRVGQASTFHHELAHILDRRYGRPLGFDDISSNDYVSSGWQGLPLASARRRGFMRPYGASNVREDFATLVEGVCTSSSAQMSRVLAGYQKLREKHALVVSYYQILGVDVSGMGEEFLIRHPVEIEGEDDEDPGIPVSARGDF